VENINKQKDINLNTYKNSSKTCSNCGAIKRDLSLGDRQYNCEVCDFSIDRDENAAIVLMKAASSAVLACGDIVSPQSA